ncbi:hypothetical protein GUITHDRAFT_91776 [Guillardia theta CCMP2712]|uniref:CSD domain-containing protein n=2 Tax=Guillardia theta TaxID=55529 RepID=L1K0W9_GUITC|nr:hypothetical protein GUITHDRAFT_91776 [Guillardia theta CCMP2712]EKX54100.1 hypothetical protein GUITHDRAFT_91776 [Guillardia theta CCMP2712]|eukprot:XP_005841080.1 hypothetical protein GUITHDRAFT_91776 [Guillardia theta CCMP2712]
MSKITGKVKWFNVKKGYGFITPTNGGEDIFVHQTAIHAEGFRSLKEEEEVEFEISDNGGKSKAINVTGPAGAYVQGAPRHTKGSRNYRPRNQRKDNKDPKAENAGESSQPA